MATDTKTPLVLEPYAAMPDDFDERISSCTSADNVMDRSASVGAEEKRVNENHDSHMSDDDRRVPAELSQQERLAPQESINTVETNKGLEVGHVAGDERPWRYVPMQQLTYYQPPVSMPYFVPPMYALPAAPPQPYYQPVESAQSTGPPQLQQQLQQHPQPHPQPQTSVPLYNYVRVTHIMDLDGFVLHDGFLCKEMALIEVGTGTVHYEHFRLGRRYCDLTPKDRKVVNYVSRHVHGIPFVDHSNEELEQSDIRKIVLLLLSNGNHELSDVVVGYKGGNLERMVLDSVGIPSVNLELIGCPKYDELMVSSKYDMLRSRTADQNSRNQSSHVAHAAACPLHVLFKQDSVAHCAKHEVVMFRRWYLMCYLSL
jgi:hypothetical protein